ncbi:MAG: CPBP family intramembrane glutamic endopeptidase [Saccharofermentanales bacterium]
MENLDAKNNTIIIGTKNDVHKFLLFVIPLSVPFYLLNLITVKLLPFNLPASALMILVPSGLGIYYFRKNSDEYKMKDFFRAIADFQVAEKRSSLVLSLLFMPVLYLIAVVIKDPNSIMQIFREESKISIFIAGFLLFFLGAIIEELAWTTYATPALHKSYGILKTGFIIGLVWGLWHLVPYIMQGRDICSIFFLVTNSVAFRIIMGYLYNYSNGATISALFFHTMINLVPELLPGGYKAFDFSTLAILLWLSVIVCYIVHHFNNLKT